MSAVRVREQGIVRVERWDRGGVTRNIYGPIVRRCNLKLHARCDMVSCNQYEVVSLWKRCEVRMRLCFFQSTYHSSVTPASQANGLFQLGQGHQHLLSLLSSTNILDLTSPTRKHQLIANRSIDSLRSLLRSCFKIYSPCASISRLSLNVGVVSCARAG